MTLRVSIVHANQPCLALQGKGDVVRRVRHHPSLPIQNLHYNVRHIAAIGR